MKVTVSNVKLNKDISSSMDGLNRYYHNDISINAWLTSSRVDASLKILLRLTDLYLLDSNKRLKPEERVFIQNTALSTYKNSKNPEQVYYDINTRNTVKALDRLFEMGAIKYFLYEDKDGNTYKWENGSIEDWQNGFAGLTKRYIVLDINRIKELLTITNKSDTFIKAEKRSSLRRLVMRRPFTLVDHVKALRNKQVEDINAAKKVINLYLVDQYKRFGDFSGDEVILDAGGSASEAVLSAIYRYIYDDPNNSPGLANNN